MKTNTQRHGATRKSGVTSRQGMRSVASYHLHLLSERDGSSLQTIRFTNTDAGANFAASVTSSPPVRGSSSQPPSCAGSRRDCRSSSSLNVVECRPSMTEFSSTRKPTTGAIIPQGKTADKNAAEIGSPDGSISRLSFNPLLMGCSRSFGRGEPAAVAACAREGCMISDIERRMPLGALVTRTHAGTNDALGSCT